MKFALQVKDDDFEQAEQILGSFYDDKSDILIYDPLTGEPPAGKFVLIAISNVWLPKYSDRISGYINGIKDIPDIIGTMDGLSLIKNKSNFTSKNIEKAKNEDSLVPLEKMEEKSNNVEVVGEETPTVSSNNDFLDISQDEDVQEFFVESNLPKVQKIETKFNNINDFSFAEEDSVQEVAVSKNVAAKIETTKEEIPEGAVEERKEEKENNNNEIKRYYFSDSDMSYTVAVSIHIKYSSKIIAVVDDKLFQKYGDSLDENVYIFKSFRDIAETVLGNYILIITAKDKAQDKDILQYSKNPIAYWEEINNWLDKIHS